MTESTTELFDAHFHIIDPRFPIIPNDGFLPEPFTVNDYRRTLDDLPVRLVGGAVVSGSFQGFDHRYLVDALARLGRGFVGVVNLRASATDRRILELHDAGIRAVRFNIRRGTSGGLDRLERLARRVFDLVGWHTEIYLDGQQLRELAPTLARLPLVVIDHLGLSSEGTAPLLGLVSTGAKVKASGFGRVNLNVADTIRRIAAVDPGALLFGTDLPSTRAASPFTPGDISLVIDSLGPTAAARALAGNAKELYGH